MTWRGRRIGARRRPGPGRHRGHRRAEPAPPGGRAGVLRLRRGPARRLLGAGGPGRPPRRHGRSTRPSSSPTSACSGSARCRVDLGALTANMGAWNRWCATVAAEGARPPAPRGPPDPAGPRLAARPAGRPRRRRRAPGHDRPGRGRRPPALPRRTTTGCGRPSSTTASRPVFHVADQPRVLDDAFYTDPTTASSRSSSRSSCGRRRRWR